jgi:hypothetical protein
MHHPIITRLLADFGENRRRELRCDQTAPPDVDNVVYGFGVVTLQASIWKLIAAKVRIDVVVVTDPGRVYEREADPLEQLILVQLVLERIVRRCQRHDRARDMRLFRTSFNFFAVSLMDGSCR